MHVAGLMTTWPANDSRWIAPVGHPIMHTGSAQCMHALATIKRPLDGPCLRKRGLLSCVEAQARTQSSQRVQRSRSMTIVAVPLKKRLAVRNSRVSPSMFVGDGDGWSPLLWVVADGWGQPSLP